MKNKILFLSLFMHAGLLFSCRTLVHAMDSKYAWAYEAKRLPTLQEWVNSSGESEEAIELAIAFINRNREKVDIGEPSFGDGSSLNVPSDENGENNTESESGTSNGFFNKSGIYSWYSARFFNKKPVIPK